MRKRFRFTIIFTSVPIIFIICTVLHYGSLPYMSIGNYHSQVPIFIFWLWPMAFIEDTIRMVTMHGLWLGLWYSSTDLMAWVNWWFRISVILEFALFGYIIDRIRLRFKKTEQ